MKNKIFITAILFLITFYSNAQSKHKMTSGRIIYDVTFPESKMDDKVLANMPKESVLYFKNEKARAEIIMPMGSTIVISDSKTGDGMMLMNMMGQKYAVKTTKAEMDKQKGTIAKPKVELTRETKMIAGYSCKKAIVTVTTKRGESTFDAWFTNELIAKNSFSSQIDGIDGCLMEFNNSQNGMSMKLTARSVDAMDVPDSQFQIPDGYELKTIEELKTGMGKPKN